MPYSEGLGAGLLGLFDIGKELSLLHRVQAGCGAHTAFCTVGTAGSFRGYKTARARS
jgi:hypothetical protein